jgi:2,4-dienoyl-CoA reductase-like NADH-dependent reductase (Old Yellow Enzyme family)
MAVDPRLFSTIALGRVHLRNRIVYESLPADDLRTDGHATQGLCSFYAERAQQGTALVVTAPVRFTQPDDAALPHLGLYSDTHTSSLGVCIQATHIAGAAVLVMLDERLPPAPTPVQLRHATHGLMRAASRAYEAGADGIMLSANNHGLLHYLCTPPFTDGRFTQAVTIVEMHRKQLGRGFLLGMRLCVDETQPGGLSLHDTRVVARRLSSAGVGLIEIQVSHSTATPVAHFPGWCVPIAAALKAVVDVPIMVGGLLDDVLIADSVLQDGAADLICLGERLHTDPTWPARARATLAKASSLPL